MKVIGYLTEKKLGNVLREWVGEINVTAEAKVPGTRMHWDYMVRHGDKTYAVEYHGDTHYRDANVMYRDNIKQDIADRHGFISVQLPFFVQLNHQTFDYYFNDAFDISTDYGQGFIDHKMLPASFCTLGVYKYYVEVLELPENITDEIVQSLREKQRDIFPLYVYPNKIDEEGEIFISEPYCICPPDAKCDCEL